MRQRLVVSEFHRDPAAMTQGGGGKACFEIAVPGAEKRQLSAICDHTW